VIRFIHTADWQLGKPFGRAPAEARVVLQDARLDAVDAIARLAVEQRVDHVLVAGDVFDSCEPGDRVVRQALSRMSQSGCRWWLLPGNHDYARAEGLWARLTREAPQNVTPLVTSEPSQLTDEAHLLPAPLLYRRTEDDPTAVFERMETPVGVHRIGLAHGPIQTFSSSGGSNVIDVERARKSGLDYLALGDWHGFTKIGDRTAYSGTPEPDDFGREATGQVLLVEINGPGALPTITPFPIGRFGWRTETWALQGRDALDRELAALRDQSDLARLVLRLTVSGAVSLAERVQVIEKLQSELALEVRWLDLNTENLFARPTEDDLAGIDAHGVLRVAAERLQVLSSDDGPDGRRAAAALERLFVETMRAQRVSEA
jgi:DNA repair exonuclease SbcCD nuclease subunit